MASGVMEILIKAKDQASDVMESIGDAGSSAAQKLEDNWLAVTVAGAALGAGTEAMARKQADLTDATTRVSNATSMNEDETRELVSSLTDATLAHDEALEIMHQGQQQGLESEEQLADYVKMWDTVGDATGENAERLAEASAGLRAMGIDAEDQGEAMDALGHVFENTSMDVSDFLQMSERIGPELNEMGMDVNDTAAIMTHLDEKFGSSRVAQQEFRKAVNESEGDMDKMREQLGLSKDEMEKYLGEVDGGSEILEKNAEAHADTRTFMQDLQHAAEDLQYRYGDLIGSVGDLAPLMMALGPATKVISVAKIGLSKASTVLTAGLWKQAAATWAALAPKLAIIAVIALVVAAVWYLWNNWEDVMDWLSNATKAVGEFIVGVWESIIDFFRELPGRIWEFITDLVEGISNIFKDYHPIGLIIQHWDEIVDFFREIPGRIWEFITDLMEGIWNTFKDYHPIGLIIQHWDEIVDYISEVPGRVWEFLQEMWADFADWTSDMYNKGVEWVTDTLDYIVDYFSELPSRVWEWLSELWDDFTDWTGDMYDKGVEWVTDTVDYVVNYFADLPGRVWESLSDLWDRFTNWGSDMVERAGDIGSDAVSAVTGFFADLPGQLWESLQQAIGRMRQWRDGMIDAARELANGVIRWINNMINRLNQLSINIPGLEVAGRTIVRERSISLSVPSIPELHTGGIYRAPNPGGEGLALLRDGEEVRTPEQVKVEKSSDNNEQSQRVIELLEKLLDKIETGIRHSFPEPLEVKGLTAEGQLVEIKNVIIDDLRREARR